MGRKKELIYYKGSLKGAYLNDKDCEILDNLIEVSKNNGCVKDLKKVIYNLTNDEVEQVKSARNSYFIDKKVGELRDEQTVGVAFMFFAKRLVLGDSVGLGKTVQICGLCNLITQMKEKQGTTFRFLYLTEKNLLEQTRNEMIKFTGEYVDILRGEKKYVKQFAEDNESELLYSVVGSHSLINSVEFQEYMRTYKALYGCNPFDALIVDESAVIGNMATKTYSNGKYLADDFDWVVVINATPFENNLRSFYAQLNFCDETLLPTKTVFQNLYEEKSYSHFGGYPKFNGKYKNAHIFREQVKYRYLARTRKQLGAVMKDCTAKIIECGVSSIQRELLKKTSMPQMVYDCPSYFDDTLVMDRRTTPKIGSLLDLINGEFKNESTILVYCRYKEAQRGIEEALREEGITHETLNGDTTFEDKNSIVSRFKMGDFRVLITNIQKGLNFGNCNVCIFYSYDPNPNKMVQFEGRTTRSKDIIGKHCRVLVTKGKERNKFEKELKERAKGSDAFAGSDYSCILSLLLDRIEE